jgi:hypothetical protein
MLISSPSHLGIPTWAVPSFAISEFINMAVEANKQIILVLTQYIILVVFIVLV